MPVENKYVVTNLATKKMGYTVGAGDGSIRVLNATFDIAAADDDGSIYRVGQIPSDAQILQVLISCTAVTGGTDYELGFYQTLATGGAVVSKGTLMTGQTLASALTNANGMSNVSVANRAKAVWELLGLSANPKTIYDLAFTADTAGTGAGTVNILVYWK